MTAAKLTAPSHTAPAPTRRGPKTRVGGITLGRAARIRGRALRSPGTHWGTRSPAPGLASGSRKYLQPEPMLQDPEWMKQEAQEGFSVATYAYARNNPLHFTDPTGLYAWGVQCESESVGFGGFLGINPMFPEKDRCQDCRRAQELRAKLCKVENALCRCAKKLEAEVCRGVARLYCPERKPSPEEEKPLQCPDGQYAQR